MDSVHLPVWKAALLAIVCLHVSFEGTTALTTAAAPRNNQANVTASANGTSPTAPPQNDDGDGGGCRGRGTLPCGAVIGIIVGIVVFVIIVIIVVIIVVRLLIKKNEIEPEANATPEYGTHEHKAEMKSPQMGNAAAAPNKMPDFPQVADRRSKLPPLALSKEPVASHNEQWGGRRETEDYQDEGAPRRPPRALPALRPSTSFNAGEADPSEMHHRRNTEHTGEWR